jgi:hypothetical protein
MIVKGEADVEYTSRVLELRIHFPMYSTLVLYNMRVLYTMRVIYMVFTMYYVLPYLYTVQYNIVKYNPLFLKSSQSSQTVPKSSLTIPKQFPKSSHEVQLPQKATPQTLLVLHTFVPVF